MSPRREDHIATGERDVCGEVARTTLSDVRQAEPSTRRIRAHASRRRLWIALAAGASIVAVLAIVLPSRSNPPLKIVPYRGPLPRFAVPTAYHVTYTVTGPKLHPYTQRISVRRPFQSYETEASGENPYLTMVFRLGQQVFRSNNGAPSLVYTAMSPARRDIRLDTVASDAIRDHRLRLVGRSRILGRACYVFRSAAPLNAGPLQKITRGAYVDSCVDRHGLVLDERTVKGGKQTLERRATHVRLGRRDGAADFAMTAEPLPSERGGGAMRSLTLDSRPIDGPFWDIPRAPEGFRHTARYVLVPSQPQAYADPGSMTATGFPRSLVVSIDDVYVRGPDALVIEQGSTVNDAKFSPPDGGRDVDLGPVLGHGQLLLSAPGSEVVAEPHDGTRFVRIVGTLPPDQLIALARSMTRQPFGELRPL